MTNDDKITACAEAAHEVSRVYNSVRPSGRACDERWWADQTSETRESYKRDVVAILGGDDLSGSTNLPPDAKLFVSTVRGMAAALGMKVTYPAVDDFPRRTIDWGASPPTVTFVTRTTDTVSGLPVGA
jgi:hypothetical protein